MKKKRILILIAVMAIAVVTIVRPSAPPYSSVLEANWSFELPAKALWKEVYEADTGASFHGDGTRYHIFSYDNESVVEDMLPWSYTEGTTLSWTQNEGEEKRYNTYSEDVYTWLDHLNVPKSFFPEFEGAAYWYGKQEDNSQIVVIWNRNVDQLYIVENLI